MAWVGRSSTFGWPLIPIRWIAGCSRCSMKRWNSSALFQTSSTWRPSSANQHTWYLAPPGTFPSQLTCLRAASYWSLVASAQCITITVGMESSSVGCGTEEVRTAGAAGSPDLRGSQGARDHQRRAGQAEGAAGPGDGARPGKDLLGHHEDGDDGAPDDVHDPDGEQQRHQQPAAADAGGPVAQPHRERAARALAPPGDEIPERMAALPQAQVLGAGELEDAGGEQDG